MYTCTWIPHPSLHGSTPAPAALMWHPSPCGGCIHTVYTATCMCVGRPGRQLLTVRRDLLHLSGYQTLVQALARRGGAGLPPSLSFHSSSDRYSVPCTRSLLPAQLAGELPGPLPLLEPLARRTDPVLFPAATSPGRSDSARRDASTCIPRYGSSTMGKIR